MAETVGTQRPVQITEAYRVQCVEPLPYPTEAARLSALGLDQAEARETMARLKAAPGQITEAARKLANLRRQVGEWQISRVDEAKAKLDQEMLRASIEAPIADTDEKGRKLLAAEKEQRAKAHIAQDQYVREARELLAYAERELFRLQTALDLADTEHRAKLNEFASLRAQAELQTALLRLYAGMI